MSDSEVKKLKALLDQNYIWPAPYTFKFIVKKDQIDEILILLPEGEFEISLKESKKGNYISITVVKLILASDEVLEVYQRIKNVEGVFSI